MTQQLAYRLESFPVFWQTSAELRAEHGEDMPHDPRMLRKEDEDSYFAFWLNGLLQIVTVRDGEKLVGYFVTSIRPHSHYRDTLAAYEDSYFLTKPYRKGYAGIRLIREAEAFAQAAGAKIFYLSTPVGRERQIALIEHLGWEPSYITHSKWIGE